ncbi:MAG: hypothetical protein C7B46_20625 [Sulfobacillus benefaciens]|uniref:Uncharacterized protein n=1 Tax=Sulfobacillus benefaciens TaxID=453960 RepID=A0A2T2WTD3_9FIRM|nr:MAG: hypothetical protein C7B46_20625 [Sulfobacillus benefaciens]
MISPGLSAAFRPQEIFGAIASPRRGRPAQRVSRFPDGSPIPSRSQLLDYIVQHVLVQYDAGFDGPLFCLHMRPPAHPGQRGERLIQLTLGPPAETGAWILQADRRALAIHPVWSPPLQTWMPVLQLQRGNLWPMGRLNGRELAPKALRQAILRRHWITADVYDRYVHPDPAVRAQAITHAVPGVWL